MLPSSSRPGPVVQCRWCGSGWCLCVSVAPHTTGTTVDDDVAAAPGARATKHDPAATAAANTTPVTRCMIPPGRCAQWGDPRPQVAKVKQVPDVGTTGTATIASTFTRTATTKVPRAPLSAGRKAASWWPERPAALDRAGERVQRISPIGLTGDHGHHKHVIPAHALRERRIGAPSRRF